MPGLRQDVLLAQRPFRVQPLFEQTILLVGPNALTGPSVAKLWGVAFGREAKYAGDDVTAFEARMASFSPAWLAYDMRLMMSGIRRIGMHGATGADERLQSILGRPLRTYAEFVREVAPAA